MVTIEIAFKEKKNGAIVETSRAFPIDPEEVPIVLLEGFQEGKAVVMREALIEFLGLTEEESRQLRLKHIKQIGAAINEAVAIPNA